MTIHSPTSSTSASPSQKTDPSRRKQKKKSSRKKTAASRADKHRLYEEAVQGPEAEVGFIDRVFKKRYGRVPTLWCEDFCGTATSSCEWVRRRRGNRAIGIDLDESVLEWGRENNLSTLTDEQRSRITLIKGDVLDPTPEPVQVIVAMNFSYMTFKTRDLLRSYFRRVRANLLPDGLFVCDCYGGTESQDVLEEERECSECEYVWEQAAFNPITNETKCKIHFRFPDGSEMRNAFIYDWRLWSIAEIREIAEEAGFAKSTVYWEGTDSETDEGNGVFRPTTAGEVCPGWVAYLVFEP